MLDVIHHRGALNTHFSEYGWLNSLPNDKTPDWSKPEAFADNKIKCAKLMIFDLERVENNVGEGENAGHQHFLLFLRSFQKVFYWGGLGGLCGKELIF